MCLKVTQELCSEPLPGPRGAHATAARVAVTAAVFLPRQKLRGKVAESDQAPAILLMERADSGMQPGH